MRVALASWQMKAGVKQGEKYCSLSFIVVLLAGNLAFGHVHCTQSRKTW
jgi:hypothetical protein